jgi:hypothetical protein
MICEHEYSQPQPLRRLIQDALSEDELSTYCSLEQLVRSGAHGMDVLGVGEALLGRWEEIRRIANDGVKRSVLLLLDEVAFFGWPEGGAEREPTKLAADTLLDGEFLLPKNEIRAPDGLLYRSCIVTVQVPLARQ